MLVWPPHDIMNCEHELGELNDLLKEAIEEAALPPAYFEHHIVTLAPPGVPVFPYAACIETELISTEILKISLVSLLRFGPDPPPSTFL